MPCYEQNGLFAYIQPAKAHVNLGFHRGADLSDPDGLLKGEGKTKMRSVKLRQASDIRPELFQSWVRQAVELNAGA